MIYLCFEYIGNVNSTQCFSGELDKQQNPEIVVFKTHCHLRKYLTMPSRFVNGKVICCIYFLGSFAQISCAVMVKCSKISAHGDNHFRCPEDVSNQDYSRSCIITNVHSNRWQMYNIYLQFAIYKNLFVHDHLVSSDSNSEKQVWPCICKFTIFNNVNFRIT